MLPAQQQQSMTHKGLGGKAGGSAALCNVVADDLRGVSMIAADCDRSAAVDRELAGLCRCDHVRAAAAADDDPGWSTSNSRKGSFSPEDWAAVDDVVDG